MTNPYQTTQRINLAAKALGDPEFITVWERNEITHCMGCDKKLHRGIDTDIYCNVCWDAALMSEEPTSEEKQINTVARHFKDDMMEAQSQYEKERILKNYDMTYACMEEAFLKH